jgi:TrmH family RNA methyltransferase
MLGKNRISTLRKLHQKKNRAEEGLFLAEGAKIVEELLRDDFPVAEILALPSWINRNRAKLQKASVLEITQADMERISTLVSPSEVLAVCEIPKEEPLELSTDALVLVLDSIRDPGNMGTLIRLADWFGFDAVVASEDSVEWTNPKVIQASMGSFLRLRPYYGELQAIFKRHPGLPVTATELQGESLYTGNFEPFGFFVLSNESRGLSEELKPFVNRSLHIPTFSKNNRHAESLNVATAGAIILSEIARRKTLA